MSKHVREFISEEDLLGLIEIVEICSDESPGLCDHEIDVFTTGTQVTGAFIDGTIYTTYEAQEADNA